MDKASTEFSVVCESGEGAHFRVRIAAPTPAAAVTTAIAQGHDAKLAFRSDLPEADQRRALEALRSPGTQCPVCSYPLTGLPEGEAGQVTCPECGSWRGSPGRTFAEGWIDTLNRRGAELLSGGSIVLSLIVASRLLQGHTIPRLAGLALAIGVVAYLTSGRTRGQLAIVLAAAIIFVGVLRLFWP